MITKTVNNIKFKFPCICEFKLIKIEEYIKSAENQFYFFPLFFENNNIYKACSI